MRQDDSRRGPVRRGPGTVLAGFLFGTALLAGALAGCGAPAPELDRDAAAQLQSKVLSVTQAAANDPAASLGLLDELATELDEAAARGAVSFRRHQSVRTSIEAVRVELMSQQAARAAAEQEAAAKAAADAAAAAPPPVVTAPVPAPENPGRGKAKGKDKDDD